MSDLYKRLQKFLQGTTNTTDEFRITSAEVNAESKEEWSRIADILDQHGKSGLILQTKLADTLLVTMTEKATNRGPQTGLEGETRTQTPSDVYNPFRPRYRKLSTAEAEHHDALKNKATELLSLIDGVPNVRSDIGPNNGNVVQRDLALARTHLEDAVMRAVRALTA
jgi:hypothetical protein